MTMTTHTHYPPRLEAFSINGARPFWSPADAADQQLGQAHALLTLLSGAHDVCEVAGTDNSDAFDNIRHEITSAALDGVATLIALAQFQLDAASAERAGRHQRAGDGREWSKLVAAYETAKAHYDANNAAPCDAAFGTPECEAAETLTNKIVNAFDAAADKLLRHPAPDQHALAYKLALLATEPFAGMHRHESAAYAVQIAADSRALLAEV